MGRSKKLVHKKLWMLLWKVKRFQSKSGGQGHVYIASKDETDYAVKVMTVGEKSTSAENAYAKNVKLDHPFLVRYYDSFSNDDNSLLFVVMELCSSDLTSLFEDCEQQKKKGFIIGANMILKILLQLLMGLNVLHKNWIMHRDLKAANIFVDADYNVKIGDFGCVRVLSQAESLAHSVDVGTPEFIAPEMWRGEYSLPVDVWALGVVMYKLCFGVYPFNANSLVMMENAVRMEGLPVKDTIEYPDELKNIIYAMLEKDPRKRPTVVELLEHPLIQAFIEMFGYEEIWNNTDLHDHMPIPNKDGTPMLVVYDFQPQRPGDVAVYCGDLVYLQDDLEAARENGWANIRTQQEREGRVMFSCLQEYSRSKK